MNNKVSDLRALIVEDNDVEARLIEASLNVIGVTDVMTANDGAKALALIESSQQAFSFVVCDWMMPNMDGLEFLERFRKIQPETPFVMLTAKTEAKDFHKAKGLGANYFLMKPLTPDDLRIRLKGVVDALCPS